MVGGSTGAGKSTLVNSLVRAPVSQAGVLRPTTRAPVLVGAPADTRWFIGPTEPGAPKSTARSEGHDKQHPTEPYLLPGLARTTGLHAEPGALRVISATGLPGGLALLDAPDLDSVVTENRTLAEKLLGAADLLLFVTTAARYADALPWTALRTARDRGTRLAVVLNRVPAGAAEEIGAHLGELLAAEGLSEAKLFVLPEVALDGQGLLAEQLIAPLGDWLAQLAEDAPTRVRVVADTLGGALAALRWGVEDLAEAVERQHAAAMALRAAVDSGYRAALSTVEASLADGRLLRGEVLVRWREFADGGELRDALKARGHGLGRRVRAAVSGKAPPGGKLLAALSAALVTLIIEAAAVAGDRVRAGWATQPAGGPLLADPGSRIEPADTRTDRARALVREWESAVRQLSSEGTAQEATALLVVLGVLGGDITATGRRALRTLIETSRTDLLHRIGDLFDADAARFTALLTDAEATAGTADRLREALAMGRPE
ncbi:MAG: hypothetical protein AUI14_09695 [Actinobacteria bacterium 13_2_20CM_2_71_6]|nr:MAG: hypothetical protein AUI14_09695 [Actinobacteria bacterium 13_2_20CM_2_71_6]